MRTILILPPALLLLCASSSAQKGEGPTATITAEKGYDVGIGLGRGASQRYWMGVGNVCKGKQRLAKFSFLTGAKVTKTIPAGRRMVFRAQAFVRTVFEKGYCYNSVAFTPEAGHHYRIVQRSKFKRTCMMEVTDLATGTAPPGLAGIPDGGCEE